MGVGVGGVLEMYIGEGSSVKIYVGEGSKHPPPKPKVTRQTSPPSLTRFSILLFISCLVSFLPMLF